MFAQDAIVRYLIAVVLRRYSWLFLLPLLGLFVGPDSFLPPASNSDLSVPSRNRTFLPGLPQPLPSISQTATAQTPSTAPLPAATAGIPLSELGSPNLLYQTRSVRDSIARDRSQDPAPLSTFTDEFGIPRQFTPGLLLVKFAGAEDVRALTVPIGEEQAARQMLAARSDVQFTELNVLLERQYVPNDSRLTNQWHHQTLGSTNAWQVGLGTHQVKIAIVDWPFSISHPDLADNVVQGWDIVSGSPIVSVSAGDFHSTHGAGLAAATINNATGIAGAGNAQLLPINIRGEIREMYDAIIWCADNGVRVVNISWDGCYSATLNQAAEHLKNQNNGIVVMAGVNTRTRLSYPNQPLLYAISATDKGEIQRTSWGAHIDFAAPGWEVYSTTTNSGYKIDSGSSYSAPLFAGMAAFLFAINPELSPEQVADLFKKTADDFGVTGRDDYYGHGRVHFGRAATEAVKTSPWFTLSSRRTQSGVTLSTAYYPGASYSLFRTDSLPGLPLGDSSPIRETNNTRLEFTLTPEAHQSYYQLQVRLP